MIIKYHNKGWNYVENATEVKTVKYGLLGIMNVAKAWHKENNKTVDRDTEASKVALMVHKQLARMCPQEWGEAYCPEMKDLLNFDFIGDEENTTELNYLNQPYFKIIFYTKNEMRYMLIFDGDCYLLNDEGKTVERVTS
jgi:hypothetical protein